MSEQFGVGKKVEAADPEQTSEEVGKVTDKKVCCGGVSHRLCLRARSLACSDRSPDAVLLYATGDSCSLPFSFVNTLPSFKIYIKLTRPVLKIG